MNKRGIQLTTNFIISMVLVLIFLVLAGCVGKKVADGFYGECPAGYELISSYPVPEIETFCGTFEAQEKINYRCCQRESDPTEICRYNLNNKKIVSCLDLDSFDNLYEDSFTCQDNTPCGATGTSTTGQSCAGVACDDSICVIQTLDGKKTGKCVSEFILNGKQVYAVEDGITTCGLRSGPDVYGTDCSDEQLKRNLNLGLGNHCIIDVNTLNPSKTRFGCTGNI